jgi:hypothetical protein
MNETFVKKGAMEETMRLKDKVAKGDSPIFHKDCFTDRLLPLEIEHPD